MKSDVLKLLRCPDCSSASIGAIATDRNGEDITTGSVHCGGCQRSYAIVRSIPRFVSSDNYAQSFGYQWKRHSQAQLDRPNYTASANRFFYVTGWSKDLRGQRLLEAGSGAGRFTEVATSTGAEVYSFDFSEAVDANRDSHGARPNLHLVQADIYRIPFRLGSFDKVVCLGVLQHCPDPAGAFQSLVTQLAPGGDIVIDVYGLRLRSLFAPKYWLRPLTTRLPRERLHSLVERTVPLLLPLKRWLVTKVPLGRYPAYLVPIAFQPHWNRDANALDADELMELSVLDTFDWYSPVYDKPQTLSRVRRWFEDAGLSDVHIAYGPNGIVGKGKKPI